MKKQQLVAAGVLILVAIWMVVPHDENSQGEGALVSNTAVVAVSAGSAAPEDPSVFSVRAQRVDGQPYIEQIRVRGRTQAFRHVEVRAEQAGRVVDVPAPRGTRVSAGDVLCEIAVDTRDVDLQEAESRLDQAEFEYSAALDLQARSLTSEVEVAQLKAALESSRAQVARSQLALKNTEIVAPFDGVVETRTVEVGDLLNIGSVCASVLDDSPMLLVGLVPEQDVGGVSIGARVDGKLLSGEQVTGTVTYLARAADAISRSYRLEIELDPQYQNLREGITVELMVDADEVLAHRIPSSALTLDDSGAIGVKILDGNNRVHFNQVEIVGDDTNQLSPGIWVTGLADTTTLITLGQEIVFPGQVVEANFDWNE